ncbi:alpha/beta fold hydrolase [Luteibacter sp. Lutesp34]|uniref:alpha/beta fold hydrolase n=1 Tax=Luteibacter sp. Lutesp34 TaxID=3243030 RepID=UPI0039B64D32
MNRGTTDVGRRGFMRLAAASLAVSTLAACAPGVAKLASPPASSRKALDARAFTAARRYARTPFGNIAYVEQGSGDAALFLHGFPLNGFQWRDVLPRLADVRRCVAPDFLGLGYTEPAAGQGVAPAEQVDMLVSFMDALAIGQADVVANDSGGAVAQLLATRHPDRVRSLLLTNCDTEHECPPAAMAPVIAMSHQGAYVDTWLRPWLEDKALARSPQGLGGMTFCKPGQPTDEALEMYLSPLVAHPDRTHAYALALEENSLVGIGPKLASCPAPMRVVWGMSDTIFSPEGAAYLDRMFAHSRGVRRIAEAKLFFPEEFPEVIAAEARELWSAS